MHNVLHVLNKTRYLNARGYTQPVYTMRISIVYPKTDDKTKHCCLVSDDLQQLIK